MIWVTPPDRKGPAADVFARTPRTIMVWGLHVATSEDLSVVLSEFAHALVTDFSIGGILDHLVGRIVDILPIDAAGVSLISPTTYPLMVADLHRPEPRDPGVRSRSRDRARDRPEPRG